MGVRFSLAHGVHGSVERFQEVKTVKGDLGVGQVLCSFFLKGWRQVHADLGDDIGSAVMHLQSLGGSRKGLGILARCSEEQAWHLGMQIGRMLEEIQVAPDLLLGIVYGAVLAADRAREAPWGS